ncbi:hypothetical protein [Chryseobacterium sp. 2987]|uniref:hypothetical protein n=1 Tax=Chryseobacterium sp. 2987 TaxID=2817767 RepID=UPI00286499B7|nr:hypothetical protein [Chryseobacterium sp. 2987]MDR6923407.1 hypothetical protein [Chryseobacterium sp. 2987]
MKKVLILSGLAMTSLAYSQGILIINNYSKYDFSGTLIAGSTSAANGCYPRVGNTDIVKIPADSHTGNGKELMYKDYQSQFTNSLYPTTTWEVYQNPLNHTVMSWDDPNLAPGGTISTTTQWYATKFSTSLLEFHANLALITPCNPNSMDTYTTPSGNEFAEIFTINGTTYLQLYSL